MPHSHKASSLLLNQRYPGLVGAGLGAAFYVFYNLIVANLLLWIAGVPSNHAAPAAQTAAAAPNAVTPAAPPKEQKTGLTTFQATADYLARFLSDWINMFSLMAFGAGCMILAARLRNCRIHESVLQSDWLNASSDDEILHPEHAVVLRLRMTSAQADAENLIPLRLLNAALLRSRVTWSQSDVTSAVTTQAELIELDKEAQYGIVRYLAWAIPSLGFIGTVLGLGWAISEFSSSEVATAMPKAIVHLHKAFDTTMVGLLASLVLMAAFYIIQAREDALIVKATEWCYRGFVFRMYSPDASHAS